MFMSIIMGVCLLPVLLILYLTERNEATPKKGLILGVTLPPEGQALPEVQAIVARFKKELNALCLLCAALAIPLFLVRGEMLSLSLWMVWMVAAIALPMLPHIRANRALKALKRQHGWTAGAARLVDTSASEAALPRPIGLWQLALPLIVSLLPLWPILRMEDTLLRLPLSIIIGVDSLCLLFLWACGRWMFRRRSDMVTEDSTLNQTLMRVRRLYWDRLWVISLWGCAGLNLAFWFFRNSPWGVLGASLLFGVVLIGAEMWGELATRRAQEQLTAHAAIRADEDDRWIWGIFYYDPEDRRVFVSKRVGISTTCNLGHWGGKLLMGFSALAILVCLFIGPILGVLDSTPTHLTLTDTALVSAHGSSEKYTLPLSEIESVQLREELPVSMRVFGTGMEHYLEGTFTVEGDGSCQLCLDPTAPPFLRVEADGVIYWLGAADPAETRAAAEALDPGAVPAG